MTTGAPAIGTFSQSGPSSSGPEKLMGSEESTSRAAQPSFQTLSVSSSGSMPESVFPTSQFFKAVQTLAFDQLNFLLESREWPRESLIIIQKKLQHDLLIPTILIEAVKLGDWTVFSSFPSASVVDLDGQMISPYSAAIVVNAAEIVRGLMQTQAQDDPQLLNAWKIFNSSLCRDIFSVLPSKKIKELVVPIYKEAEERGFDTYTMMLEQRFPLIFPSNND